MKYSISLILLALITLFLASCVNNKLDVLYPKQANDASEGIICDTTASYSLSVKPVIDGSCFSCHNNSFRNGNLSLEGYDNVLKSVQSGKFYGSINHDAGFSPMPQGGNKLSDCKIRQIKSWIDKGALNN